MKNHNKLDWLEALRGIAATLVVLTHARYFMLNTANWEKADEILRPGAMGVDLFFIISGFIMAYSTRNSDGSLAYAKTFAIKRFARVWPVYAIITFCWIAATQDIGAYFSSYDNVILFLKSIFFIPVTIDNPPYFGAALPLGWTLEFEMYFYAIFCASLCFKQWRWLALFAWMIATVLLIPMQQNPALSAYDATRNLSYSFVYFNLMSNPIIFEFLAGAAIGLLYLQDWARIRNPAIAYHLLGLSIALTIWLGYSRVVDFHGPTKWGGALALTVLVMAIASKTVKIPAPRWLVWLGSISFSLYLSHTITHHYFGLAMLKLDMEAHTHSWGYIFMTTVTAISVAAVVHRYLEKMLSEAMRNKLLALLVEQKKPLPQEQHSNAAVVAKE
jgi:exopolysaccharide production protein ExoZ